MNWKYKLQDKFSSYNLVEEKACKELTRCTKRHEQGIYGKMEGGLHNPGEFGNV